MNIHKIMLEYPNQLKSDSRDHSSSMKSEADESKQTYTAIIFNDAVRPIPKEVVLIDRRQSTKLRQSCQKKMNNGSIEDLLTVNSLSKMMVSQKDMRNSATLFVNVKVNSSIDNKGARAVHRPVSAFTRNRQVVPQCLEINQIIKQCSFLQNRDLSLSGKNCFEDSHTKFQDRERESTYNKLQPKMVQTPTAYGYIAKSRLLSSKQTKKSVHSITKDKIIQNKNIQSESAVNFESLYKNLLINNRTSKSNDKNRAKKNQFLQKKQKKSFQNSLKIRQNGNVMQNKQNSNTLIVINNERNSIYTLKGDTQDKNSEIKCSYFSNSLHKHHSKVSLTTEILKSMKKGKTKISKILELNKESVVEPKLLIQNVDICKKVMESTSKTPSNTSYMSSQKSIAKYLTKLSYSMSKQKDSRERDGDCRLTVQCKKVTYF